MFSNYHLVDCALLDIALSVEVKGVLIFCILSLERHYRYVSHYTRPGIGFIGPGPGPPIPAASSSNIVIQLLI